MLQSAKNGLWGALFGLFGAGCCLATPPVKFPVDENKEVTFYFANECCGPMEICFSLTTNSIDVISVGGLHIRYHALAAADWQKLFSYMQREFLEPNTPERNVSKMRNANRRSLAIVNQLDPIAFNNGFVGHETIGRFLGMLKDTSGRREILKG